MVNQKPLPALPAAGALSIESRNHRGRLIRHFLADIHEPGIESRREGWAYVFEEVMDDLSERMDSGEWLSSIKRGRMVKRNSKNSNASKEPEPGKENIEEKKDAKPLPEPPLKVLRSLAARPPLPPGEPRVGHLALCLAPHGSRIPLPTEDSGFDIVPANIGCVFSAGSFALQEPTTEQPDGSILFGLDGLEGNFNL
jgi:1-phosphatidylinositol-3-phosphate 5-kinase